MRGSLPIILLSLAIAVHSKPAAAQADHERDPLAADAAADIQTPPFKSGVDLVALSVTVTDPRDKYITGLAEDDFQVFEDGIVQNVSFFGSTRVPLDLAILLDTSASMADKMALVQEAAVGFARTLGPGGRAAIIDLKDRVDILQPFTENVASLEAAVRRTGARGGTALYNAMYIALKQFESLSRDNPEIRRQAIVVLSDGVDTASGLTFDDVLDLAKRSGVAVYTISLRSRLSDNFAKTHGYGYFSQADYSMKAVAQETGARAFFPTAIKELPGVYGAIAEELANQYALGYAPKNAGADGLYRRVLVRIASRPEAKSRTRPGYFASGTIRHGVVAASGVNPENRN